MMNDELIYHFSYQTAVMVMENKSTSGEKAVNEAVANGFLTENGQKQTEKPSQKQTKS